MGKTAGQRGIRLDDLNEVNEENQGVVDTPLVGISNGGAGVVEVGEEVRGLFFRELGGENIFPIPEAAVVSCRVTKNGEVVKKRAERFLIKPVGVGD